jgi:hypothetical protein
MTVNDIAGLSRLRHWVGRLEHDDETSLDRVVTLYRSAGLVGRIICSMLDLAWDAYRICAGIRFRREDGPALDAPPLLLAA